MKLAKWIIAAGISYLSTMWIKNMVAGLLASIAVWYFSLYILNRFLEE